ncbi:hypothetical protein FA95DRAFT_1566877 [Auriscalpium vulgare]|uniref:Uncharacterized protein n=1 Tax=Auriscalpium vulgare TaxID=40419 RepID=A0ACB8R8A1_9AGAM|nr:hypothetical protein FA95DRAFT_1566877 [Auriscalpium vulgare]
MPFDPTYPLPLKLRQRIQHWENDIPKTQFQMYGPLNNYFYEKFPGKLIKPQALFRDEVDPANPGPGRLSIDSMGAVTTDETKLYPDFAICSYGPRVNGNFPPDVVHLIVEVGSLGADLNKNSAEDRRHITDQLKGYLRKVGPFTNRSVGGTRGVAILGLEMCVISWVHGQTGWYMRKDVNWSSIYGPRWDTTMEHVAQL